MIAGAVVTAVLGGFVTARWDHPGGDIRSGTPGLVLGICVTVAGCLPWLCTALVTLTGRGWARGLATVFFGIYFGAFVPSLIIDLIPARFHQPPGPRAVGEVGLELLVGLVAMALVWQPASVRYFEAKKRARGEDAGGLAGPLAGRDDVTAPLGWDWAARLPACCGPG
jgi:hypothetical protein